MAACRHPDVQRFGEVRCCLSCGEAVFELSPEPEAIPCHSGSPEYRYKPLRHNLGEEIRLIVLYAGEPLDDLICDIVVVNLADRPAYEAVSYTWANTNGDVSLTSGVICRGKIVPITKNCEAALRRLRLRSRSRRLWVDAICINQNDVSEKNHQVRLMSRIYMNAAQVLAYLGVDAGQVTPGLRRLIGYLQDKDAVILDDRSIKSNLLDFLRLPYFDRVWILQEIGLSQLVTLIVGAFEVRWTGATISKILDLCFTLGIQAPSVLRWKPASRPEEEQDVLAVLSKSRNCSASNPCDKVYALLGLTYPEFSAQFPIDYSLSPSEVFTKLTVYCIEVMGRFDILQHCYRVPGSGGVNFRRTPTWIPQWDVKDVHEPPPTQFSEFIKRTFASVWHMPDINPGRWLCHELPRRLLIEQILDDLVMGTDTRTDCMNLSTAICRKRVREWAELHSINEPDRSFSSENLEYLAQQIVHEQSQNFTYKILDRDAWSSRVGPANARASPKLAYLKLRAHRLDQVTRYLGQISDARQFHIPQSTWPALGFYYCQACIDSNISPMSEDALKEERKELTHNIATYGGGKAAFTTDHSVGFARGDFRSGDSIWALYGADVPFILREVEDHHHLIGDCYLHRAGRPFPCKHCGADAAPWPMETEIVDIW